jgi:hypothetical protein
MSMEELEIPTIRIGFNRREQIATLSPPAMVVESGSRVQFQLESDIDAKAKVMLPAEGRVIQVTRGKAALVEVTQTGVYYAVVTLKNPGKVGAMAVLICDV